MAIRCSAEINRFGLNFYYSIFIFTADAFRILLKIPRRTSARRGTYQPLMQCWGILCINICIDSKIVMQMALTLVFGNTGTDLCECFNHRGLAVIIFLCVVLFLFFNNMDWRVGNKRWIDITCNAGKGCLCGAHPPTGITAGGWGEAVDKGIILPQVTCASLRCDPTILWRRIQHLHLSRQLCGFNEKGITCLSFVFRVKKRTNRVRKSVYISP